MTKLRLDISTSLDGFVAGPNRTVEQPLGDRVDREADPARPGADDDEALRRLFLAAEEAVDDDHRQGRAAHDRHPGHEMRHARQRIDTGRPHRLDDMLDGNRAQHGAGAAKKRISGFQLNHHEPSRFCRFSRRDSILSTQTLIYRGSSSDPVIGD